MRIGVIGSGMMGSTLGRLWAKASHEVRLSSRHPEALKSLADSIGASTGTVADTAAWAEVLFLGVPFASMPELITTLTPHVSGKLLLDAGNIVPNRDGALVDQVKALGQGSGGWVQAQLPSAQVVKAFNTVYFKSLETRAHQQTDRIGVPLAGNNAKAMKRAEALVNDAGFDAVLVGDIGTSARFDFGTPVWNTNATAAQVRVALGL